jgi:hypothetical protein
MFIMFTANGFGAVQLDGAIGDLSWEPNQDFDDDDKNGRKPRGDAIQYGSDSGESRRRKRNQRRNNRMLGRGMVLV